MSVASAVRVEVNHQKQSLMISYQGEQEILQISDTEMSLNLEDLAQQVSGRSRCGLRATHLTEPLRELRVARPAVSAGVSVAERAETEPVGVPIWLRSLSGTTLGPYNTASIRTVAQLKSKVLKDAHFPVAQQEIAQGDRLLPDATKLVEIAAGLMEIDLQLLLLSPSPCRVALRFRPRLRREAEAAPVWRAETQQAKVVLIEGAWHGRKEATKEHSFDAVFDEAASGEDVYHHLAADLPQRALEGICSVLLCYGASGTGKSFSLFTENGLIPRMSADLFEQCRELDTVIAVSFLSIVHEEFRDLLHPSSDRLMLREVPGTRGGGRTVLQPGASSHLAASPQELSLLLDAGLRQLAVDATTMELKLSEVTQIVTIHVARLGPEGESEAAATIQFVHMADSARSRETRPNRSVTGLMEVVSALARRDSFIPYRNSKLTRWLQPALRGCALLRLLCTASPVDEEETLRSMLFAADARQLSNFPKALSLEPSDPEPQDAFALQLHSLRRG